VTDTNAVSGSSPSQEGDGSGSLDRAIEVVARTVIAEAVREVDWDYYPDLGEHDWYAVIQRARELSPAPDYQQADAAFAFLTERAIGEES
jgi:hypothetical protein